METIGWLQIQELYYLLLPKTTEEVNKDCIDWSIVNIWAHIKHSNGCNKPVISIQANL